MTLTPGHISKVKVLVDTLYKFVSGPSPFTSNLMGDGDDASYNCCQMTQGLWLGGYLFC